MGACVGSPKETRPQEASQACEHRTHRLDNTPGLPQQRSLFNHAPFFCTLCCYQRKAHNEPGAPVQQIYSTKSVLQMVMEHAFVEPAHKISLTEAAKKGAISKLRAKLHLNVDINSGGS